MQKWNPILKIAIKALLVIFGCVGIIVTVSSESFMNGVETFYYFTIQSNLTIIVTTAIFLINDILILCKKKGFINSNIWYIIKFVFTVAITVTFLVFFLVLAPTMKDTKYLLSFSNLCVHFAVPVLALLDFFLFDYDIKLKKEETLWALAMPLYYLAFALIGSAAGLKYPDGNNVPYFFLDYGKYGWFGFSNGLGVFYWIIIMLLAISGLAYLLRFFMLLRQKHLVKKENEEEAN